jgi:hypothetical protein
MSKAKKKAATKDQMPGLDFLSNITNFDMPEDFDFNLNNDDNDLNDDELERELNALNNSTQPRTKAPQQQRQNQTRKTNNKAHDLSKVCE